MTQLQMQDQIHDNCAAKLYKFIKANSLNSTNHMSLLNNRDLIKIILIVYWFYQLPMAVFNFLYSTYCKTGNSLLILSIEKLEEEEVVFLVRLNLEYSSHL